MEDIRPVIKSYGYLTSSALSESTRLVYLMEEQGKRKIIGQYDIKEKIFSSERFRSKHYLRKYQGWGIDSEVFHDMCSAGLKYLVIHDKESNSFFKIKTATFKEHMQSFYIPPHRSQFVVSEKYWVKC